MKPRRSLSNIALFLSAVGMAACIAAMVALWIASNQLGRATENLLVKLAGSLTKVQQRGVDAKDRIAAAAVTTQEIEKALQNWARRETSQRIALQLNVAEKSARLGVALEQADHWLEICDISVGLVREGLSIRAQAGASPETRFAELAAEIAALRSQLAEAKEMVGKFHERIAGTSEEKSLDERIEQAVQLGLRVIATFSSLETRLENFTDRLSAAQEELHELKTTTRRWILIVTGGLSLIFLWMGAGQAALFRLAWNRFANSSEPRAATR